MPSVAHIFAAPPARSSLTVTFISGTLPLFRALAS